MLGISLLVRIGKYYFAAFDILFEAEIYPNGVWHNTRVKYFKSQITIFAIFLQ